MTLPKSVQLQKLLPRLDLDDAWGLDYLVEAALDLQTAGPPKLEPFRLALLHMPLDQVRDFRRELDALKKQKQKEEDRDRVRVDKERAAPSVGGDGVWTLRQEKVLCGKPNCAKLHGPYWYGYRTLGQRTKKKYFGKKKPTTAKLADAAAAMLQKETERAKAAAAKKKKRAKP